MILKTKIITIISLAVILAVGATTTFLLNVQGKKMLASEFQNTEFIGDIISRSTEEAMKDGRTEEVQKIIENIGNNKNILALRILSPDGTILKSKKVSEIGAKAKDYMSSSLQRRKLKPTLLDDTTINYFNLIPNKQECYGCHSSQDSSIGIIQIKQDISRNVATMLSLKRFWIFSILLIVLVIAVTLSVLFSKLIMNPLKTLLTTIHDVEAGNWQATVKIRSDDELGIIGKSFNNMISEINRLYQKNIGKERELSKMKIELNHKKRAEDLNTQLELKIKELETANRAITSLSKEIKGKNYDLETAVSRMKKINEIGRMLTSIIETDELIKIIIRTTAGLISAETVTLHLNNIKNSSMTIQYRRGIGIETLSDFSFELEPAYIDLLKYGKPVLITGVTPDGELTSISNNESKIGVPLKIKGQIVGALLLENKITGGNFKEDELDPLTTLANQAAVAIDNASLYDKVKSNYFAAIQSLVNALEANDKFTKGHSERVKLLSLELGKFIGLDLKELEVLEHAAILHDIGKLGIDNLILQKQGKLTPKETGIVRTHPQIGDEILSPIATLAGVRETIVQHHERYDGNGYPNGLRGDELSLKARILTIVDTFDAMMSTRPYRDALTLDEVKIEIRKNSGTQFDPYLVNAFIELVDIRGDGYLSSLGYKTLQTIS